MRKGIQKILLLTILIFIPFLVLGDVSISPITEHKTIPDLVAAIIKYIRSIAFVGAPIIFIYAGLKYYFAGGCPEKVKEATDIIKWAFVGLIIILLAEGITGIIRGVMGVDGEDQLSEIIFNFFVCEASNFYINIGLIII